MATPKKKNLGGKKKRRSRKAKKMLPPHILAKFREHNEQTRFLSEVQAQITKFQEALETQSEIRGFDLSKMSPGVAEAVAEHFRNKGWTVEVFPSLSISIYLPDDE